MSFSAKIISSWWLPKCASCWTSQGSFQPLSGACWAPLRGQNDPLVYAEGHPHLVSSANLPRVQRYKARVHWWSFRSLMKPLNHKIVSLGVSSPQCLLICSSQPVLHQHLCVDSVTWCWKMSWSLSRQYLLLCPHPQEQSCHHRSLSAWSSMTYAQQVHSDYSCSITLWEIRM